MTDEKRDDERYDPPEVEQIPTGAGPSLTAAGHSPSQDGQQTGPEWRPEE